jgi:hypothetical protein
MSTISASTTSTTAFKVTSDTTGTLVFQTGAVPTTAISIDASQAVGIGTTSPATKLNVVGTVTVDGVVDVNGGQIDLDTGQPIRWGGAASSIYAGSGTNDMVFTVGSSERFRVNGSSGNLGIGTSSPAARLDASVSNPTRGIVQRLFNSATSSQTGAQIQFAQNSVADWVIGQPAGTDAFAFWSGRTPSADGTERLRIDSSGNLGIGTSSPAFRLHVSGSSSQFALISTTDTTSTTGVLFGDSASNTVGRIEYVHSDNGMRFYTNGTTQATLDSSGNLGLGVTPSVNTIAKAFELQTGFNMFGYVNIGYINANAYYDGGFKYKNTAAAGRYEISDSHKWFSAASGTAGNAISFTQAMTLDASGNLALGNTSANGMRLLVSGYSPELYDPTTASAKFAFLPKGSQEIFDISTGATLKAGYANLINISVNDNNGGDGVYYGAVAQSAGNSGSNFVFGRRTGATSWAESARITAAGNLLVGCTAVPSASVEGFCVTGTSSGNLSSSGASTSAYNHFLFLNGNGTVGSISTSSSTTTYSTSSDRRLKDNIVSADDAGSVIDAIEVVKHDWKVGGHTRYGMIAQDLHMVAPEAVSVGDADNVEDFKNPWGVDYSKLVPMLVKELQSVRARLAALEGNN